MVLGIHTGHDSSAALVIDGKIIADVAEERFVRVKHYSEIPFKSVAYCLEAGNISMEDVDVIAIPCKRTPYDLNHLLDLPASLKIKQGPRGNVMNYMQSILGLSDRRPPRYIKKFCVGPKTEIVNVEHHLAHAASAYYTSGDSKNQLIFTIDGVGDGVSVGIWRGRRGKINPIEKYPVSASIGFFYSNVTEALGWWHGDGEGKTMGLAPYGDCTRCRGVLDRFYPKFENGKLVESHDFGRVGVWNDRGGRQFHFPEADKIAELVDKYGREHIAAETQQVLEEQVANIILPRIEQEKMERIACAGGVFLNVKLNQRLWESGKLKRQHIYPNSGDAGVAVGAALWAYYNSNPDDPIYNLDNLYFGPEYPNDEIEKILKARNLSYRFVEDITREVANHLANNKIVAWFQGRMESGPRSLGNRSILMSANKPENKDIINARVKFREAFRPFCPSLLFEGKDEYLLNNREEPFMITSFNMVEGKRDKVPAVVHVDGTVRPQTVRKQVNPLYWDLIHKFGKLTGETMILNTSFNIMGEPIICHPREAIRCFFDNGLDYLVMGNWVLEKNRQ